MLTRLRTLKKRLSGRNGKGELQGGNGRAAFPENGSFPSFSEEIFTQLLCLERKRAGRSRKPFALMLLDAGKLLQTDRRTIVLADLALALSSSTRETDVCGWHTEGSVIGVILTEIGEADTNALRITMLSKVSAALRTNLEPGEMAEIHISFHIFPEDLGSQNGGSADTSLHLYPDLHRENDKRKAARLVKRAIDLVGSLTALILLSPLLLAIALAIKLTSKGPVLFAQKRIGQYGVWFTFLKFRSMHFLSDSTIHQEYVRRLISGEEGCKRSDGSHGIYKLNNDPRITPIGKFLRRTSLDELPQFFNVLRGEMSLVGPRPPILYEIEAYDIWHRRRLFEAKPGITGLWQVNGRSKLKFDEMVRLDLKYARDWSLALDLKILLQTPRAVLFGKDAF
jgi:lipopolysaccharide/colanic/teichoic acid biosynthesis glycosyltransferase